MVLSNSYGPASSHRTCHGRESVCIHYIVKDQYYAIQPSAPRQDVAFEVECFREVLQGARRVRRPQCSPKIERLEEGALAISALNDVAVREVTARLAQRDRRGLEHLPAAIETHALELFGRCLHRAFPLSITLAIPLQRLVHFATAWPLGSYHGALSGTVDGTGRPGAIAPNRPEILEESGGG
jgi:hypothetical protein